MRDDETPTAVERPPVELSRPEEDELVLDRPLFGGNTDVVDVEEYERLVSSSGGEDDPELEFDQAPTPISSVPTPIPRPPVPCTAPPDLPLAAFARSEATVELTFGAAGRSEETPPPPLRTRVATPCAIGIATDRGLPAIVEPRRARSRILLAALLAGGALLLLGLVALVVFLIARAPAAVPPAPAATVAPASATPALAGAAVAPASPTPAVPAAPSAAAPTAPLAATTRAAREAVAPTPPDPLLAEAASLERRGARQRAARLRVQAAIRRGEWAEAERRWRALPASARGDLEAVLWQAEIAAHRGRLATAEWIYRWLVRSRRGRGAQAVRAELGLGEVLLARGRPREACVHLRRAEAASLRLSDLELKARAVSRLDRCRAF